MEQKEVKEIARRALEAFGGGAHNAVDYNILMGFFQGVADGKITHGQSWVVDILRVPRTTPPKFDLDDYALIKDIIASGMGCNGQPLFSGRWRPVGTSQQADRDVNPD